MSGATHSTSPHTSLWEPVASDMKNYRHFDAPINITEIKKLVRNPSKVIGHSFMPLIHFEKRWRRAPKNGVARSPKIRALRYASRKDAYIYKHYRELLAARYEAQLAKHWLCENILAYRRIPLVGGANKSNIEFARDAFQKVKDLGKCTTVAIDISDFFGSISHDRIKQVWCDLLGVKHLPEDHYRVYRSIVNYRYVDRDKAYIALGYSEYDKRGKIRYTVDPESIDMQICSMKDFRELIVGGNIVEKHVGDSGIPQGLPISDLIANSYLFDFDVLMKAYATKRGGVYVRYSDDILFILPGDGRTARGAAHFAADNISRFGSALRINAEKTEIACYTGHAGAQRCYNLKPSDVEGRRLRIGSNEGLSYLGFRFDGQSVFFRNSTIAHLNGKLFRSCRAASHAHVNMHMEKDLVWLLENRPISQLRQQFMSVEDFEAKLESAEKSGDSGYELMTFWSYAKRSVRAFSDWDNKLTQQLRNLRQRADYLLRNEITASFASRALRKAHE